MFIKFSKAAHKLFTVPFYCVLFVLLASYNAGAQCAMCRAALEGEANKARAAAVNDGIVYLMVIPYVLVAAIGFYVYRLRKTKNAGS